MNVIDIEYLEIDDIGISPGFATFMKECASYCFASQNHQPGVNMPVIGNDDINDFSVYWPSDVQHLHHSMNDDERTTEYGAMGVSLLLITNLTKYKYVSTARRKGGFDYWLFEEEPEDVEDATGGAILEVSGIRKTVGSNTPKNRALQKANQTHKSGYLDLITYISIVEFHRPESIFRWH